MIYLDDIDYEGDLREVAAGNPKRKRATKHQLERGQKASKSPKAPTGKRPNSTKSIKSTNWKETKKHQKPNWKEAKKHQKHQNYQLERGQQLMFYSSSVLNLVTNHACF